MKKQMMKMTAAAALVMGLVGGAQAATSAQVNLVGSVTATTCDVSLSGPAVLDVGAQTKTAVDALTADSVAAGNTLVGTQTTKVMLANCDPTTTETPYLVFNGVVAPDTPASSSVKSWGDASASNGYGLVLNVVGAGTGANTTPQIVHQGDNQYAISTAAAHTAAALNAMSATLTPEMIKVGAAGASAGTSIDTPVVISFVSK